ncbi:MAG: oligosaccharide flippase family protein [Roseateles sp.]|uniref:oligosaccharide flippase family protein n=1 Tax=Roseateles sp. TaxID=1971397 RepID=UPI004035BB55
MRIVRHSLLNLIGLGAPLLVALFAIPVLLAGLGTARFGLLTLIWALVSYFGLFDLGLARALTLRLAVVLEKGEDALVGPLCGTALILLGGVGLAAGLALYLLAPWLVGGLRDLPDVREALVSLQWLALALPMVIGTAGLRGMLEACGAFGLVNGIRVPMGIWTFVAPVIVLHLYGADLTAIAAVLTIGRLLGALAHGVATWYALPQLRGRISWRRDLLGSLLRSSQWLLVSNLLGPLMGYADRFIVGLFVPVATLAYYATPQELVMKLWILPGALTAVLFPALAAQIAQREQDAARLCRQALLGLSVVLLPITLGLATFAGPLLSLWLDAGFAAEAQGCLLIFSLGMFVTGLAQLPYTALQSAGRAATTAKLHLLELPIFIVALAWAASQMGIEAAACVWLARVVLDAVLLVVAAQRLPLEGGGRLFDRKAIRLLMLAPFGFVGLLLPTTTLRISAWLLVSAICVIGAVQALLQRSKTMTRLDPL